MNTVIVIVTLAFYPNGVYVKMTEEVYMPPNVDCYAEVARLEENIKDLKDRKLVSISCSKKGSL